MGVLIKLNGQTYEATEYKVTESSTPLAGGDGSGAVGVITCSFNTSMILNPILLSEKPITFIDTKRGTTLGTIRNVDINKTSTTVTADTRLNAYNIEVTTLPYTGTLEGAFVYYSSLANIDSNFNVDNSLGTIAVNFPGWTGNLWQHMKKFAMSVNADLNLISNNLVMRPVRQFIARANREFDSEVHVDSTQLALKQEVVWYKTRTVEQGLIYPPGGWNSDVRVLSVPAGQTIEYTLDTNGSIYSIIPPIMKTVVAPNDSDESVYTIVGDDNLPMTPEAWDAYGGSLTVAPSEDRSQVIVTITGARGYYQANGQPMRTYRVALSGGTSDSTYSTLRLVGRYVELNQQSIIIPTGVEDYRTGQEFAPTIDNIFLNSADAAYSAGVRGARRYSGKTISLSANVSTVNRRGIAGTAYYPPYSYVKTKYAPSTYGTVNTLLGGPATYGSVRTQFYAEVQVNFEAQVFGNVPGARFPDRASNRWYRVRDATTEWGQLSVEADDDLLFGDIKTAMSGLNYGQAKTIVYTGLSYHDANLLGVARGSVW